VSLKSFYQRDAYWPGNCGNSGRASYFGSGESLSAAVCLSPVRNRREFAALLIVNSDLAFTFWLGQALDRAGYPCVPAKNTRGAGELLAEQRLNVNIVVIDPSTADALPFLSRLRERCPGLKTVAALSTDHDILSDLSPFTAVKRKPRHLNADAVQQWVRLVQSLTDPIGAAYSPLL